MAKPNLKSLGVRLNFYLVNSDFSVTYLKSQMVLLKKDESGDYILSNKLISLNALLRDPNAWFFELDALCEPIIDRDFIQHLANFYNCDYVEKITRYITVGTRTCARGYFTEADYASPSECYRRFHIARKGEFIPVDGYDRLIVVFSLDLKEIYVSHGGRRRQKLVNIADLMEIMAHLGETGEMQL